MGPDVVAVVSADRDCGVCHGSGRIRLTYSPPARISYRLPIDPPTMGLGYREYPCPECGTMVERQRIMNIARHEAIAQRYIDEALPHIKRAIATGLGQYLLEHGMIYFDRRAEPDLATGDWDIRGMIGVVRPEGFLPIEERIVNNQYEVAHEVIRETVALLDVWGRDYGETNVPKAVAKANLAAALEKVRKQYDGRVAVENLK